MFILLTTNTREARLGYPVPLMHFVAPFIPPFPGSLHSLHFIIFPFLSPSFASRSLFSQAHRNLQLLVIIHFPYMADCFVLWNLTFPPYTHPSLYSYHFHERTACPLFLPSTLLFVAAPCCSSSHPAMEPYLACAVFRRRP